MKYTFFLAASLFFIGNAMAQTNTRQSGSDVKTGTEARTPADRPATAPNAAQPMPSPALRPSHEADTQTKPAEAPAQQQPAPASGMRENKPSQRSSQRRLESSRSSGDTKPARKEANTELRRE